MKTIFQNTKGDFKTLVVIIITIATGIFFLWLVFKMVGIAG